MGSIKKGLDSLSSQVEQTKKEGLEKFEKTGNESDQAKGVLDSLDRNIDEDDTSMIDTAEKDIGKSFLERNEQETKELEDNTNPLLEKVMDTSNEQKERLAENINKLSSIEQITDTGKAHIDEGIENLNNSVNEYSERIDNAETSLEEKDKMIQEERERIEKQWER